MGFLDNVRNALKDAVSSQSSKGAPARKDEVDVVVDTPAQTAEPTVEPAREAAFENYTVRTGDSLPEIGARFGVPSQEIARLNSIENPDLIFPGQVFRIPKN